MASPLLSCFTLVGDSNVRRHLTSANTRGAPLRAAAKFIPSGGKMSVLSATLESVDPHADACVLACLTNLLTGSNSAQSASTVTLKVESTLRTFFQKVFSFGTSRPSLSVFIVPPMYRTTPLWYRDGLSEVCQRFSSEFMALRPPGNVFLLPSFAKVSLESDGVHLDPTSGLEYILYLFEAPQEILRKSTLSTSEQICLSGEDTRALGDRVLALEQDHARLSKAFEHDAAVQAELLDLHENVRCEQFFMIQGLPRIEKVDIKTWSDRAKVDVGHILEEMGLSFPIRYIQNSTGRGKDSKVLYKVCMHTVEASRTIRDKFGLYFAGGKDTRPPSLAKISIRNCVTTATLARVAILQLLAKRYKESNPGSRTQVISYEPRPLLRLTPPPDASDKRIQSFTFVEAVTKLPVNFSKDEIDGLLKRVSPRLHGSLKSTLIVLDDDMVRKRNFRKKSGKSSDQASGSETSKTPDGQSRKRGPGTPASGPSSKK